MFGKVYLHISADLSWEIATLSLCGHGQLLYFIHRHTTKGLITQELIFLHGNLMEYIMHEGKSVDQFSAKSIKKQQ